jgi:pSer/pThr/pTyr-binding forkhead associated (FHA) protein
MATCPSGHESADDDYCDVCGFAIGPVGNPSTIPAIIAPSAPSAPSATSAQAAPTVPCPQCGVPRAGQFCESCGYDFAQPAGDGAQPPPVTRIEPAAAPPPAHPLAPPPPPPAAAPVPQVSAPAASAPSVSSPAPPAPVTVPPGSAPRSQAVPLASPDGVAWTAVVTADRAYYDSVQATGGAGAGGISFPVYCPQRRFRLDRAEVRVGRRSAHSGIDPEIDLTGPPADPGVSRLHAVLLRGEDGSWSVVDPGSANGTLVNGAEIARDELVPLRDGDRIHLGAWTELRIITEG